MNPDVNDWDHQYIDEDDRWLIDGSDAEDSWDDEEELELFEDDEDDDE